MYGISTLFSLIQLVQGTKQALLGNSFPSCKRPIRATLCSYFACQLALTGQPLTDVPWRDFDLCRTGARYQMGHLLKSFIKQETLSILGDERLSVIFDGQFKPVKASISPIFMVSPSIE